MKVKELKEQITKECKPASRPMGIMGELASPETVFVRQFRWTLESKLLKPEVVQKLDVDFTNKTIDMHVLEIVTTCQPINVHHWLDAVKRKDHQENLTFTTYDGCGNALYQYVFHKVELVSDGFSFDYSKSDISVRKIRVKYDEASYELSPKMKQEPTWHLASKNSSIPIKLKVRPTIDFEETEINFLNAKAWVPGRAAWLSLEFETTKADSNHATVWLACGIGVSLELREGNKVLETWELNGTQLKKYTVEEDSHKYEILYDTVKYRKENDA